MNKEKTITPSEISLGINDLLDEVLYWQTQSTEANNKIDKAIEYLEAVNKSNQKMFVLVNKQDLLDILKGVDKE